MAHDLVKCAEHPDVLRPGYVVCSHVAHHGARIAIYERGTATEPGLVLCHVCDLKGDEAAPDLHITCAACIEKLLVVGNLHSVNDTGE